MYLFSCDLLLILSLASNLGSLMVSDSTGLYLIRVQQKGLFKYKLWEWQHAGSICKKMDVWKWRLGKVGGGHGIPCEQSVQTADGLLTLTTAWSLSQWLPANTCSRWGNSSAQASLRWELIQCQTWAEPLIRVLSCSPQAPGLVWPGAPQGHHSGMGLL